MLNSSLFMGNASLRSGGLFGFGRIRIINFSRDPVIRYQQAVAQFKKFQDRHFRNLSSKEQEHLAEVRSILDNERPNWISVNPIAERRAIQQHEPQGYERHPRGFSQADADNIQRFYQEYGYAPQNHPVDQGLNPYEEMAHQYHNFFNMIKKMSTDTSVDEVVRERIKRDLRNLAKRVKPSIEERLNDCNSSVKLNEIIKHLDPLINKYLASE